MRNTSTRHDGAKLNHQLGPSSSRLALHQVDLIESDLTRRLLTHSVGAEKRLAQTNVTKNKDVPPPGSGQ